MEIVHTAPSAATGTRETPVTIRRIPIAFACAVNKSTFRIDGEISIASGQGFAAASCHFDRQALPEGFQPEILSYVAITGYPDASLNVGNATNPFNDQGANFRTTRELNLGKHGGLSTTYLSTGRGTPHEKVDFTVAGDVDIPHRIVGIAPLCEVWTPTGKPDTFAGQMTFTWLLADGSQMVGTAQGEYAIHSAIPLLRQQMRVITFDLAVEEGSFCQKEAIRLFDLPEWNKV